MPSKAKKQTLTEQPAPVATAEKPAPADILTDDERAVVEAYRQGKPLNIIDLYVEKHQPAPLPADFVFPHDERYAKSLVSIYDPDDERMEVPAITDYMQRWKVSYHVASTAVAKIYKEAQRELDKDEKRLIRAVRDGNIDFARELLTQKADELPPPDDDDELDRDDLTASEKLAFGIVGNMARESDINRDYLQDSDLLTSLILTIAQAVDEHLPELDHVAIDHMFARRRAERRASRR